MTAKEQFKRKLIQLRRQSDQTGQIQLSASAVTLGAEAAIHFLLAAVLSGVVLLEDCAPFGVALVGAAGSERGHFPRGKLRAVALSPRPRPPPRVGHRPGGP